jgi:glyoxylase-like metal-dependent hydrolase (beta-lactamase superfamily II)
MKDIRALLGMTSACVLVAASTAFAQQPVTVQPRADRRTVGDLEVAVLSDGGLAVPNDGSVFGLNVGSTAVAGVLGEAGAPTDTIRLDIDALFVRTSGHLVLIDTGFGPAGHGVLHASLGAIGVSPGQITDVLITHSHPDHAGGLVDAQGRSAFPNAVIRMSQREWRFMQDEPGARAIVAAVRTQVRPFQPGGEVLPGIRPIALYGHTPGHVMYAVSSRGTTLLDIGDAAHSSIVSLARPDWTLQFDTDKAAGAAQRRRELRRLAASHTLIFAPHFSFPGVGRVERRGRGFGFRPVSSADAAGPLSKVVHDGSGTW